MTSIFDALFFRNDGLMITISLAFWQRISRFQRMVWIQEVIVKGFLGESRAFKWSMVTRLLWLEWDYG